MTRRWFSSLMLAAPAVAPCAGPTAAAVDSAVRLAISEEVVFGVNRNDASAAIGVWSSELARTLELKLVPQATWLLPSDRMLAAVRNGTLDLFCLTVLEYRQVESYVDAARVLTDGGDELLLLVREGGGIANLAGLEGRSMIVLDSASSVLADAWLSVWFAKEGLASPPKVLARISRNPRIAQVVLPVFFGQADACVAPRRGVETMFEMNPQLPKKLKVLAAAPKMISAFMAVRKSYPTSLRNRLFEKISRANSDPAAKQVLTLFQSKGFALLEGDVIRPSMSLLDAYGRQADAKGAKR